MIRRLVSGVLPRNATGIVPGPVSRIVPRIIPRISPRVVTRTVPSRVRMLGFLNADEEEGVVERKQRGEGEWSVLHSMNRCNTSVERPKRRVLRDRVCRHHITHTQANRCDAPSYPNRTLR